MSAEKLRAQVNGLLAPQAVEVTATVAPANATTNEKLSDQDVVEELLEIAAIMAHMLESQDPSRRHGLPRPCDC